MKKIWIFLLPICLIFAGNVFADAPLIESKTISEQLGVTQIKGSIPRITGLEDTRLESELNGQILARQVEKVETAAKSRAKSVEFRFQHEEDGDSQALLFFTTTSMANISHEDVVSLNYDFTNQTRLDLSDILGPNAVPLINRHISNVVRANPAVYNADYPGVEADHAFYTKDGALFLLFDKYELAPGTAGIVTLEMELSEVNHVVLRQWEYVKNDIYGFRMIPLRRVCEGLGYTVTWFEKDRSAVITRQGDFSTVVALGQNNYGSMNRELEAAPALIRNSIYVPISFFETILGAVYTADRGQATLTFSQY